MPRERVSYPHPHVTFLHGASTRAWMSLLALCLVTGACGVPSRTAQAKATGQTAKKEVALQLTSSSGELLAMTTRITSPLVETVGDALGINAAPVLQQVSFDDLRHPIIVEGSLYTGVNLQHKFLKFHRALAHLEQEGWRVGVMLRDLDSGAQVSYARDDLFYSASSIKAPYVACLYESLEKGTLPLSAKELRELAAPSIEESNNDTYRTLRRKCGDEVFARWCVDNGIVTEGSASYKELVDERYPLLTPRQLTGMWEQINRYLARNSERTRELNELLAQSEVSPLRQGIVVADLVLSKGGWYPLDDGDSYSATIDAGIVEQGGHRYAVVVMTNAPMELDELSTLTGKLFVARRALLKPDELQRQREAAAAAKL